MSQLLESMPATEAVINVASVPHRSPFRYPGGKTWLVPYVRLWLKSHGIPVNELVEPFAGGAIVGISAVMECLARKATLIEIDPAVGSVWQAIFKGHGEWLANRITTFQMTPEAVRQVLKSNPRNVEDRAFATILRNRVQRGGILASGAGLMKRGENGKGLASRWYPETLKRRILAISAERRRFRFLIADGLKYLENAERRKNAVYFIDPPYTLAGRRLYTHSEIDHERLFMAVKRLNGDFLMTYDDSSEIRQLLVRFRFDCETVAMRNTHNVAMNELLIGKNLDWARRPTFAQGAFHGF